METAYDLLDEGPRRLVRFEGTVGGALDEGDDRLQRAGRVGTGAPPAEGAEPAGVLAERLGGPPLRSGGPG